MTPPRNYLKQIISKHKWLIVGIFLVTVFESVVSLIYPYFIKFQIDELQKTNASLTIFIVFLVIPFTIQGFNMFIIQPVSNRFSIRLRENLRLDLQKIIFQKLSSLDNSFFDNNSNLRLVGIARSSASSLSSLVWQFQNIFSSIISILGILPILLLVDYRLLLLVLASSVIQAIINLNQQKAEARLAVYQDKLRDNLWPLENLLGYDFGSFRLHGNPEPLYRRLDSANQESLKLDLKRDQLVNLFRNASWLTSEPINNLSRIIVAAGVIIGKFTLGDFNMINAYLSRLSSTFSSITSNLRYFEESRLNLFQLNYFLQLPSRLVFQPKPLVKISSPQTIHIHKLHFAYPAFKKAEKDYIQQMIRITESFLNKYWRFRRNDLDFWQKYITEKEKPIKVINNLNMDIKPGKITALLGRNGAGKTTLTNLILHTIEPNRGQIYYGSTNIRSFDFFTWLNQFSVVQQHPFIAHRFSLRENLSFGVVDPTDSKLWQTLTKIGLSTYLKTLPKGLDSILGEDINLSGGQNQLLAISRALLQNRPFLILDEALSQLDIEKEAALMDLLKVQAKTSGILFITHRITTARKADYIYMLDQGKIVEEGTHPDLLAQKGLYAHFWDLQTIS